MRRGACMSSFTSLARSCVQLCLHQHGQAYVLRMPLQELSIFCCIKLRMQKAQNAEGSSGNGTAC